MPIVFAGIAPHSPLLLEHVGKEKTNDLKKTLQGLHKLEEELYLSEPDVLFLISDHNKLYHEISVIIGNETLHSSLEEVGDLTTKESWPGSPIIASKIATSIRKDGHALHIGYNEKLSYGSCIPLLFLTRHMKKLPVVPFGPGELESKELFHIGADIKTFCFEENTRVAILVTGNGAHTLSEKSPAGYHPDGEIFDTSIISHLETKNTLGIVNFDDTVQLNAKQSLYHPLLVLLGALKNTNFTFKNLSYEHPHGVGYLVGNFELS
ncbi:MAG: class III extradiol dioxygenase subunit B-like domain-containing protein [Candidatus Magasanikbacteria bacterium]